MLDAVLREELAVLITCEQILLIVLVVAGCERLLDASSRRCVVAGDGETNHRTVGEGELLLHEALSERAATDDGGAVVVLHGAGENLRSRSRTLIDEHHERNLLIRSVSVRREVLSGRLASDGIYYQLVLGQKLVSHLDGRVHIASRVVTKVDDEVGESLLRQLGKGDEHFGISGLAETLHLNISCVLVEHIRGCDALLRYVATRYRKVFHGFLSVAHHTQLHLRVLRTFQASHGLLVRDNLAHERLAVHAYNLVAGEDASTLCRTVLHDVLHVYGVLAYGELDAHSRERSLQVVSHSLRVLRADVYGVRVEVGENLRYGYVHERVDVHLVHVLIVYKVKQIAESVRSGIDDVESVAGEVVGVERANHYSDNHAYCHYQRHKAVRLLHIHNRQDLDMLLLCLLS